MGLTGYLGSYLFMGLSQRHVPSNQAGVLSSLAPLFTFIVGIIFFSQPFKWSKALGVGLGLIGCLFILFASGKASGKFGFEPYALFMIGSVFCSGVSINLVQKYLRGIPTFKSTAVSYGAWVFPSLFIFIFFTDWRSSFQNEHIWVCMACFCCLSLLGTVLATLIYYHIISLHGALYTSTVTYIIPITALMWGFIDGESIYILEMLGFAFILGSIKLIRR